MSFVGLMRNVPGVMVRLGVTQFFSWAALFLMWTYLKPAITGVVTDHATGASPRATATNPSTLPACSPGRWASRGCACCTTSTR